MIFLVDQYYTANKDALVQNLTKQKNFKIDRYICALCLTRVRSKPQVFLKAPHLHINHRIQLLLKMKKNIEKHAEA